MHITQIAENDRQIYNAFVIANNGSFLQSYAWGEWQESLGRKAYRYLITENDNKNETASPRLNKPGSKARNDNFLMTAQFIEHKTPLGTYLYCPYGPIQESKVESEKLKVVLEKLISTIKEKHPNILFTRLEPTYQLPTTHYKLIPAEHVQPPQTLLLDITKTPEELLKSFHPKTRYNIKVAEKHNVAVHTFTAPECSVIDLIMQTSERQHYRNHSREYIEKLWSFFAQNKSELTITGYIASVKSKSAASGLMVDFGTTRMYLFGGSNYSLRESMAPYKMHWQAIQDAKGKGFIAYDFGASETASGGNGGFMRFKMGFNPEIKNFGGTWDIANRPIPYHAYTLLRKINRYIKHI